MIPINRTHIPTSPTRAHTCSLSCITMPLSSPFTFDSSQQFSLGMPESSDPSLAFTPHLNSSASSTSYFPSTTQQTSQSHDFTYPNALGLSEVASSSSSNWNWDSLHGRTNQHRILSMASHENLVNACNNAYMQLLQRVSTLSKDLDIQEAKYLSLEHVSVIKSIHVIELTIRCHLTAENHMRGFS